MQREIAGYNSHYQMLEEVLHHRTYSRTEKTWRVFLCWHLYLICAIVFIIVFYLPNVFPCLTSKSLLLYMFLFIPTLEIPFSMQHHVSWLTFMPLLFFSHLTLSYKSCYQWTFLYSTLPWKSSHLKIIIAFHFGLNVNIPFFLKLLLTGCFIIATGNEIKTMFIGIEIIFSLQCLAKLWRKTFHFFNCYFLISLGI